MDLLLECAQGFERLIPYQYHIVIGQAKRLNLRSLLNKQTSTI